MTDQDIKIRITGRKPQTFRIVTGWHTFDRAFIPGTGKLGFPVKSICELAGHKGVGKSTFALSLAGKVASHLNSNILMVDTEEHFDEEYTVAILTLSGFAKEFHLIDGKTDSDMLTNSLQLLKGEDYCVGILDSVGAVSPIAEEEGNLEDANMGRRARLMSAFSKMLIKKFRAKNIPSVLFATNHLHPNIGSLGHSTSGGQSFRYLTGTRIMLYSKETFDDGSYILQGKVTNNTFGVSNRVFYVFSLAGHGVHSGLTAVWDCIMLKRAKLDRTVKLGDKNYGYIKNLITKAGDEELFVPFVEALRGGGENTVSTGAEDDE